MRFVDWHRRDVIVNEKADEQASEGRLSNAAIVALALAFFRVQARSPCAQKYREFPTH